MQHAQAPVLKRLSCSFCMFFGLFVACLHAQDGDQQSGFIISLAGDTTWGQILSGKTNYQHQRRVYFVDELGMNIHYDPELISGYGYGDSVYVSRTRPFDYKKAFERDSVFMKKVVSGPATLLRYFPPKQELPLTGGSKYIEYLIMPDGQSYELIVPHYQDRLRLAFLGMPTWTKRINRSSFSREELPRLVRRFNQFYREPTGTQQGDEPSANSRASSSSNSNTSSSSGKP